MDSSETRRRVDRILDAPLEELARGGDASDDRYPQLASWRLPDEGKTALRQHGLPPGRTDELSGVVGEPQESADAVLGPDGRRVYLLGSYGDARLAAVEESGEALAFPVFATEQATAVNSTLEALVECAWRWHWLLPLLADEQQRAGAAEIAAWKDGRLRDGTPEPYGAYQDLCACVLGRFREIDPAISDDSNFWVDVIVDVW